MTITEYNRRLEELTRSSSERAAERIILPAANRLLGTIKNRIQRRGQKSDGSSIGQYSQRAGYYRRDQFVKRSAFKGLSKRGYKGEKIVRVRKKGKKREARKDWTFKVVKKTPRTMYLERGYFQLREIQGRPNEAINLTYTGDLMASYKMHVNADKKTVVLGLDSAAQAKKKEWHERKRGKIFHATKSETKDYTDEVNSELSKFTVETITGFRV